jgi:ABC-2 type transport system ATP-binding protein
VAADALTQAVIELREQGTSIILSTHDMNVAERMCDFIFMIYQGKKVLDGTLASIQDQYGSDVVRVRLEDGAAFPMLPGVAQATVHGPWHELQLTTGTDPQQVLTALAGQVRVRHFELARPSLHDIFVRIAGPEGEEVPHA